MRYGVLLMVMAADVFRNYIKYVKNYGDIIQTLFEELMQSNERQLVESICFSMRINFEQLHRRSGNHISKELASIKV